MNTLLKNQSSSAQLPQELFIAAFDASNSGVVITDHQQHDEPIIYCNQAFERLSGYNRAEIIGRNCRLLQDHDRNQASRQTIKDAIAAGEHCQIEIRNYTKSGQLFWNELILSPVKNSEGVITHFVGIQNEITRRKEAELKVLDQQQNLENRISARTAELELEEAYLSSVVETIRESLVVLDPQMHILSVNAHFLNSFKMIESEVKGKLLFELGEQWDLPELCNLLHQVLPDNNPFEDFEIDNLFPHVGRKHLILNARQITLKGQYQNRILLAIEDITEWSATEQRKADFINLASHEMRTPMTSIKGNLQLMKRKMEKGNEQAYLPFMNISYKAVDRLEKLVSDLLDAAKIQTGEADYNFQLFDFDQMVNDTVKTFQAVTSSHEIQLQGETHQEICGDRDRLAQVVLKLLSNAVKYSPQSKEVILHLGLVSNFVRLSIADTGIGIGNEDIDNIFDRFYRAETTQEKFPGVGLGLFICKQIIEKHHGTLWVESEPEKGTTLSFTLPVALERC